MTTALPEWRVEPGLLPYPDAIGAMEARAAAIRDAAARELVWLVEHSPVYTAGTSANAAELLDPDRFPVFAAGRGGRHTYHGPGQRVVYVMLDLGNRGRDLRAFVAGLENWVIAALADFGIAGRIICGKVGVWVDSPAGPAKIAAIGVRVRRWVSFHGLSINVEPDLSHFSGIVPCGLSEPVTSLAAMGKTVTMADIDAALLRHFSRFIATDGTDNDMKGA
ncbi:lipoyl(octanoyl) transferase LipB [Sandarakinorhabdus sp.]|uniref:lipoyl(octanoyl) transferase LipB n=1 Tax=Sandarakinorhabdus sp. TaxID=1916663 RepID=UPI00286EA854|nr:lipoyl(octanoyl) transferase LipB [Sandarakinorhabdus sp.]